jgi:hypothetical protein
MRGRTALFSSQPILDGQKVGKNIMKRIINMKRYDTTTAKKIANWWNGCTPTDFNYCSETLYLTKNKSWFLHAEGGAHSIHAEFAEGGRSSTSGDDIIPMTEEEAASWLAKHSPSKFETHFAHLAKDA